jgi:hypothetical protein
MADQIDKKAFGFMTTAAEGTQVAIDGLEPTSKATTRKENIEAEAQYFFNQFLNDVGVEPWSDDRFVLEKLWKEGGSPIIVQKTADELSNTKKWTGNKKYYLEGVEIGRPYMTLGRLGTSGREIETKDILYINKGKKSEKWDKLKIDNLLNELAHSYDYGKRTQAARDSLEQERRRTFGLFGEDVYGKIFDDEYHYPVMRPDPFLLKKQGKVKAWAPYVPGETDIKILPPEFRTHRVIQKNLQNIYDKGTGG